MRRVIAADRLMVAWKHRAACIGFPNSMFFPAPDVPTAEVARAKAVCAICSVNAKCLAYALETNQTAGIWGGTTEDERRSLRRKWLAGRRRGP